MNDIEFDYSLSSWFFRPFLNHFKDSWEELAAIYWKDLHQVTMSDVAFTKVYFRREGA